MTYCCGMPQMKEPRLVIIGGGIAAVSCVEAINAYRTTSGVSPAITVICASELVKTTTNVEQVSRFAEQFDVEQRPLTWLESAYPNVEVKHADAERVNSSEKTVSYRVPGDSSQEPTTIIEYDRLCICTGGKPRRLDLYSPSAYNNFIITIRDTDSVRSFQQRMLSGTRRVMIVGNGGIATELAYELGVNRQNSVEVIWAIRHKSIAATFIDAGAAEFLLQTSRKPKSTEQKQTGDVVTVTKRQKYTVDDKFEADNAEPVLRKTVQGSALGPDWLQNYQLSTDTPPHASDVTKSESRLHIEYECEVKRFFFHAELPEAVRHAVNPNSAFATDRNPTDANRYEWPVYVQLTNGRIFGCDFVISATGVTPTFPPIVTATPMLTENYSGPPIVRLKLDEHDYGLVVNERMQTTLPYIYAAGDCCTAGWRRSPHWMQMRLWTQARQMGHYAGKCMLASCSPDYDETEQQNVMDFCFEIFTHVTTFFGFKVVLLGIFNAEQQQQSTTQKRDKKVLARIEPGEQYIKVILDDNNNNEDDDDNSGGNKKLTVQGAVLVGETDMEETLENLILNRMDVSRHGEHLLDPNIDVEDYFD